MSVVESAQVLEPDVALACGHLTGGVAGPQHPAWSLSRRHPLDHLGHLGGELAGTGDAGVERDGAVQVVLSHRLSQTDLPGKGSCVGDLLSVEGDEGALLRPIEVGVIVHADYRDLVVGQQVTLDGLAEREAMEDTYRT